MENDFVCKFCGKSCKNANSLKNHERLCPANPERNYVSHTLGKTAWNKGLTKETDLRVKKNSESVRIAMKNSELVKEHLSNMWTNELRQKQSERKKKFYSEHPDQHPNVKLAGNRGKMTYPEQITFDWLNKHSILNEHNYHFVSDKFNRYVDFYLPTLKIFIEVDGEHWHQDTQKDIDKDNDALKYGIKTIRIKPKLNVINQLEDALFKELGRRFESD